MKNKHSICTTCNWPASSCDCKEHVYFRDAARDLGCGHVDTLGDLAVWEWLANKQK